ncbi:translin-associated factor X [Pseudohyphozyma bogoriensis]|nr:translin-associated factor X [Pseudohyphozyma bogoriensis]
MIFALHRITSRPRDAVFKEAEDKLNEIKVLLEKLGEEAGEEGFWRYERSLSPGVQELLEALTLYHYLKYGTIATLSECSAYLLPSPSAPSSSDATLNPSTSSALTDAPPAPASSAPKTSEPDSLKPLIKLTAPDYLGGLADLTGELMRLAISSIGSSLSAPPPSQPTSLNPDSTSQELTRMPSIDEIARTMRALKAEMDPLANVVWGFGKKLAVLDQSLAKVESASYALRIRAKEYENSPIVLQRFREKIMKDGLIGGEDGGRPMVGVEG